MHGCSLRNDPLVNAEVDSMGGVVDSGVGVGSSPQRAAIEKAQAELRREFDVREERKRELEFLEEGGNPLDFKFGNTASVSVQSTSLTDQSPEQLVTSEAKGSFASTASPHRDTVESSGQPVVSEPNCADNLMLFDGGNDPVDGGRDSVRSVRSKIAPSEQATQLDTSQTAKESGKSSGFGLPKSRAYKRRNRSRPNREGTRSSSIDIVPSRGGHVSSLASRPGQKDVKGSVLDTDNQQDQNASLNHNLKPTISNGTNTPTDLPSDDTSDMVLDNGQAVELKELAVPKSVLDCKKEMVNSQRSEGAGREPSGVVSKFPESVDGTHPDCPSVAVKLENQTASAQQNGYSDSKGDSGRVPNESRNCITNLTTKGVDSESYCTSNSLRLDGTSANVPLNGSKSDDFREKLRVETLIVPPGRESDEKLKVKDENKADDRCCPDMNEQSYACKRDHNSSSLRPEEELSVSQEEVKPTIGNEEMNIDGNTASLSDIKPENLSTSDLDLAKENVCSDRIGGSTDKPARDNSSSEKEISNDRLKDSSVPGLHSQTLLQSRDSSNTIQHKISTEIHLKVDARAHEDSILKEARIIEAKRKRIAQLSVGAFASEIHQKSHWDFVLEEMAWLANDFAQERLWKISAAAQLSHRVSSTSRARLAEQSSFWKQKKVAHTLSKAIMEFWFSAEKFSKGTAMQCPGRNSVHGVQEYAVRYLKHNISLLPPFSAEAPATPERIYNLESQELSWEEQFIEEKLFYTAPPGSMETYIKAIESHLAQVERTGSSIQEEVETSICDAAADHCSQGNANEEDEGKRNTNPLSGDVDNGMPSKLAQKKRNLIKFSIARSSSDVGTSQPVIQRMENKFGTHPSGLTLKRSASNLQSSSIPTKRMRTASRPRFTTPFTAGNSGAIQVPNKTDASSGDTNSFQDDQSSFQGGSQIPNNMEIESVADFERQLPFDSAEVSKPKKKKKPKYTGSMYEKRWQLESNFQNELGGYSRKRFDKLAESNGNNGLYGQPIMKKQKMIQQPMDNSVDNYSPLAGSIPSPVASQMSNMSNSNKLVKILGGRDRGRKSKSLKMPFGHAGPGGPWSSFEEQALIVLVHDLGPNWELISDAINNILQYKCIFRKPKECSEHHKELISRTAGDGADSAEDSGSSQPYPSTLPGIPKGSARALFQRLQEPIEEDMIKFHFDKIIQITQRLHYVKIQNENREQKPIKPHSSHALALSQVIPNNISAGPLLTPLDLCDTTDPTPDVLSGGYQGTHGGGLAISNQGSAASLHQTSGANAALPGSPNMLGNNFSSPSATLNSSMRDGRYGVPRSASFSVDEHQRLQQHNQMMPGRVSGTPSDRGVRMMAGGNGIGMSGINRNMAMVRPGFPGIAASSMLNSGSMLPSNMAALADPANTLRSRDPSNMMRPAQVPEHQRQMMVPDHHMQATRGNLQGVPPFGSFLNQTSPSSQTHPFPQQSHVPNNPQHPHLHGANHVSSAQQQAYALRLAKERHLQHRLLQQQLAASGGLMPRGPPQNTGPHVQLSPSASVSSPLSPSSSTMPSLSQNQQKPHMPPHGLTRNPQPGGNQMGKQRQKQLQNSQIQAGRHHPQQRPHPQENAKLVKGAERGNMETHQNLKVENPSIFNGISSGTSSQSTEKAEQVMNTMQGQGSYPVSGLNPNHPSNKAQAQQQRLYTGQAIASSKQAQQLPSHLDNNDEVNASPSTSGNISTSQRSASPSVTSSSKPQQLQPTQKLAIQNQPPVQRVLQQNRQISSDSLPKKLLADQDQSELLHVSTNSGPSQLGTATVDPQPRIEPASLKSMSSTSGTQLKSPDPVQNSIMSKPVKPSAPIGNSLMSLKRTQGQASGDGQVSVSMPTQGLDVGTQRQPQLQKSSSTSQG